MKTYSLTNKTQSEADRERQREIARTGPLPDHIAIIMDGNGRWARTKGNVRVLGHKAGVDSVRDITEACAQIGIPHLTLFAFSTENWGRPATEINALIQLLVSTLRSEVENLHKNNIRLTVIGQIERFPRVCRQLLNEAVRLTRNNDRMNLCLALSYSGRWDITESVRKIAGRVRKGEISPEEVDDGVVSSHLATAGMPDPDLIIRTSGELRLSNFLLWQLAYSEIFITDTFWPDFRREELYQAIKSYQMRERRYGKIGNGQSDGVPDNVMKQIIS